MIINAANLQPDRRIHALLIGPSGSGKTAAAASFPGKTFILDFDDRAKGPLLGCEFLQERVRSGEIEIERMLPWIDQKANGLADIYRVLDSVDLRVTKGEIDNVIVDSTTAMRRFFVNESINRELKTSGKANTLAHYKIGEVKLGQKQDHNYAAHCMLNLIYENLKTFRCNLFVSTHLKDKTIAAPTQEDPERVIVVGQTITAPGQLTIEIPSWFDEVWEFEIDAAIKSQVPRRFVVFQSQLAHTALRNLPSHRLEITGKSLYEVLKPTMERMKADASNSVSKL